MLRSGKKLGSVLQNPAGKSGVNHFRILNVVVGVDARSGEHHGEDDGQQREAQNGSEKAFLQADAQSLAPILKAHCLAGASGYKDGRAHTTAACGRS